MDGSEKQRNYHLTMDLDSIRATESDSRISKRRRAKDRRSHSFLGYIRAYPNYRRRSARREGDLHTAYLDWYKLRHYYAALGILLFSCLDAALTLNLLAGGAVELNPFMAPLIDTNVQLFVTIKVAVTGVAVLFLLAHVNFRVFRSLRIEHLLYLSLFIYGILICYEIILILRQISFSASL